MSEQEFNKIFSKNLLYYLETENRTQAELAKYVGVSTAAVNQWCKGLKTPRMDKVDAMCKFFGIKRSDLMEDKSDKPSQVTYYLSDETAKVAQEIFEKDKVLFDVYKSSDKDRLIAYANKLKALRDMEEGNI